MKKLSGLIILSVLFFSTGSFGRNQLNLTGEHACSVSNSSFPADTGKKATDVDDTAEDSRSYSIGLEFGSDQSSHGLHAGNKLPYMEPSFTYSAPKGFYIGVSDQFIFVKDSGGFDAFALNPGWNIDLSDNTTWNINITHYWLKARTPLSIQADLNNAAETYIDHTIGETEGRLTIDYDSYRNTDSVSTPGDIILTPDISHTFKFQLTKKSSLSLIPEGSIDFGTTNAYSHYLAKTGNKEAIQTFKKRKQSNKASFAVLDYSLFLTINYKIGNFEIEPAVYYNAPIYKVTGVPSKPIGYGTLNLTYTIE